MSHPINTINDSNNTIQISMRVTNLLNGTTSKEKKTFNEIIFKTEKTYPFASNKITQADISSIGEVYCHFAAVQKAEPVVSNELTKSKNNTMMVPNGSCMHQSSVRGSSRGDIGKTQKPQKAGKGEYIEIIRRSPLLIGKIKLIPTEEEIVLTVINVEEQKKIEHNISFDEASTVNNTMKQVLSDLTFDVRNRLLRVFKSLMIEKCVEE